MANDADDADAMDALTDASPTVREARRRLDRCIDWEANWRQRFIFDIRFANGDSANGYQWPNQLRTMREKSSRPCLTMNLIKAHNRMISNEARKNKSSVRFVGMGNGATQEMAQVWQDYLRHCEYQSQAQAAYTKAREFAIDGGLGWWRLTTEYVANEGPEAWEQDLFIRPVNDPLMVYMDPDIQQLDGMDSKFAFIFDDVPNEEFDEAYPELREQLAREPLGLSGQTLNWNKDKQIRVVEYFRKVAKPRKIMSFVHQGQRFTMSMDRLSRLITDREARDDIVASTSSRVRTVVDDVVEWKLIAGDRVIDETIWLGKYIPLCRCVGEEIVIDGVVDRKGNTRAMLDAQRMMNYNASAQVEFGALQTKTPWVAPAKAIEEFESYWNSANVENKSVLPWNHVDPDNPDVPIPPPQRIDPPTVSPAFQQGMENARQQIMMVSGQYENTLGQQGNERTGAAINARRSQGATATYHFQDNYEIALISMGKMFLDIGPKLIDTRRLRRIVGDDGIEYDLEFDPTLRAGFLQEQSRDGKMIRKALNPLVGRFDVAASVGPSYDAKRDEVADNLTLVLTQAPNLIPILGDILVKNMGFEGSQEAALRLRRMVPPMALGEGPTQNEQQLQQQVQALTLSLAKVLDKNAADKLKLLGKDQLRDIETYRAETERMKALADAMPEDAEGLRKLVQQLVGDALKVNLDQVTAENSEDEQAQGAPPPPPVPGAKRAADGEWYLRDPARQGKYLRIAPHGGAQNG